MDFVQKKETSNMEKEIRFITGQIYLESQRFFTDFNAHVKVCIFAQILKLGKDTDGRPEISVSAH